MATALPELYVVGRPNFDAEEFARFLGDEGTSWRETPSTTAAERLVEIGGRICYFSFGEGQSPRSNAEYIANLVRQGHESVLEHANWTFVLTGVSRAFTHQFVRHRVGFSFSQLSQQYHDESDVDYVKPSIISRDEELSAMWDTAMTEARDAYARLINELATRTRLPDKEHMRAVRSAARSVLPSAAESKLVFTANARSLRFFLATRGAIEGDEEMRLVCAAILRVMAKEAPSLFADFALSLLPDGSPLVSKEARR